MNDYKETKAMNILLSVMKGENSVYKEYIHTILGIKYGLKGSLKDHYGLEFLSPDEKSEFISEYESKGADPEILDYFMNMAIKGKIGR